MRYLIRRLTLMAGGVVVLGTAPASANAQKALVYCPVDVDATGCNTIVTALTGTHPLGVDRGYDGTTGTVDLATVDLLSYSVFVVPSLADNATEQPYARLREPAVAERLRSALIGRIAMWSGSPDHGATNRALKDALIQNLASYAGGAFATARGPGLVTLLDASSSTAARYDWVRTITPIPVTADANLLIYDAVRPLNITATSILTSLTGSIAYTNMATYGFAVPTGGVGVSLDAVGQTGTSIGGQVVLLTSPSINGGSATVLTDKEDYVPHEATSFSGSGWQPGESVTLTLTEDPELHEPQSFTTTADSAGNILFEEFRPDDHDAGVRFVLTALGQSSGLRAQTTFTDAITVGPVATNSNGNGSASRELTINAPAVSVNDVVVAQVVITDAITTTFVCPPAGWTSIRKTTRDDKLILETFWFRASVAAPATSYTWQFRTTSCAGSLILPNTKGASGGITRFTGVATAGDPVDVSEGAAGSSSGPFNAPSAVTTTANAQVLRYFGVFKNTNVTHGTAPRLYHVAAANHKERAATLFNSGVQAGPGATGTLTATLASSAEFAAQTVALRDACTAASITTNPADQSITYGADASFSVALAGTPAPTVQWQVSTNGGGSWANLGGETNSTLTLVKPAVSMNGNQYRAVATNTCGTATSSAATLTVAARAITVTADAKSKVYGDADPALTYTITAGSLASGDALSGALVRAPGESVGSYAVTQGTLDAGPNYTLTFVGANLTITARPITVTADAKSKVYGDVDPALTYQITGGSLAFSDTFTGALARDPGEDVGSYAITQGTVALNANYTLTYIGASLTITARPITVTADPQSKVYGDADPALTYQLTGTLVDDGDLTGALARDPGENVGTYAINQGTVVATTNYTLTFVGSSLTITQRPITITADAKSKVYGNADPALTYQISSGNLVFGNTFSGTLTRDPGENVGTYAILVGSVTAGPNYDVTYVGADLEITQRPITVTADAQTKVYGEADPTLTYQITSGTLAFSDAFSGALTRATGEDVGTYAIAQGTLTAGSNYDLTYVGANLTITTRPVTITADVKTKTYGDADPALTYQITSGSLAFSDAFAGSLVRAPGENVGTYPIVQGTVALSSNYTLTYVGADLTITQRNITITADAKTKVYGDPDPALTYQLTSGSLVGTDAVTGALTRVAGENVGTYAIQQGTVTAGSNYNLSFVPAVLTITKRDLTVTADNKTKIAGEVNPPLTGTVLGVQFSDGITATYSTTAVTLSLPADYPITPALQDPNGKLGNYTVTIVNGTLTVTPNALPVLGAVTAPLLPTAIGTAVNVSAPFTDVDVAASQPYTAIIDWGNGTTSTSTFTTPGTITGSKVYPATGVYTITVTITQDNFPTTHFDTKTVEYYVVVYDPNGGFVTGGGWIHSPAGAYAPNPTLTGKANFGFVSKYQKGQTKPSGNTEFQFHAGNVNFKSSAYDWLVITGTTKAQYKGTGTINGAGNYGFLLSVIDGDGFGNKKPDSFRIKIWDTESGYVVYDNNMGADELADAATMLGGGSIQIKAK